MSARDVAFTLMALGHVAGCRGKSDTEILAEAVGEIVRLQSERDRYKSALDAIAHMEPWAAQYSDWNRVARTALEYKEG